MAESKVNRNINDSKKVIVGDDKSIKAEHTMAANHASSDVKRIQEARDKTVVPNIKMAESSNTMQESMHVALQSILEAQRRMLEAAAPTRKVQETLSKSAAFSIGAKVKLHYPNPFGKTIAENSRAIISSTKHIEKIQRVIPNYIIDSTPALTLPIQQLLQGITIDYFDHFNKLFKDFDFHYFIDRFNHVVICEAYDARWFPHAVWNADHELVNKVLDIVDITRKSNNRTKKIDKLIFDYYSKERVEAIRKSWRNTNIPNYKIRMMNQAVQAFHRREYAITVVMLSTLWEGIIYEKLNDNRRKNGNRTKKNFKKLIEENQCNDIFNSFFSEYIMYDCKSDKELKDDVPGRNSVAHGWYDKYPTRKAALNAILFTDFLLRLEPIE